MGVERETILKPLHLLVVVKNTPASFERERKNVGYFSYPVPEFTWDYCAPGKNAVLDTNEIAARGYDAIFHIDGGSWCSYIGHAIPVFYYSIDSTLSDEFHYKPRFEQAKKADLVLIDHDRLERFEATGRPVKRWLYSVNDHLFYPREKDLDVDFQCGSSPERARLRVQLSDLCKAHGWSYKSGVSSLDDYAANMGAAKAVVVLPRTKRNRPHRVYDAMASGALVLSSPLPEISGEDKVLPLIFDDERELEHLLLLFLTDPKQSEAVEKFREITLAWNTWSTRAGELRALLAKELGL